MLFCLVQDQVLRQLEGELRAVDPRARVLAFLDDVVVLCAAERLAAAYERYAELMRERGIPVQVRKSEYWARSPIHAFPVPFAQRPRVMKQQVVSPTAVPDSPLAAGSW
eukprot:14761911-Alexandrium_andersonii.AAC.1